MDESTPRRALGRFLRSRRERLAPLDVGLPDTGRRRTPGLRREEVAMLAGVSTTWYTRLEQGQDVTPSAQVLDAIADVLRLSPRERRHLLDLRPGPRPPAPPVADPGPVLPAVVRALDPHPAYLVNAVGDRLAWNRAHAALVGDPAARPEAERNLYWALFTDPRMRRLVHDWRRLALTMLADYRAAALRHPDDPRFTALTRALRRASREFRAWWDTDATADFHPAHWRFDHPDLGPLHLDYSTLAPLAAPGTRLVVATPADPATGARLRTALDRTAGPPRPSPVPG